MALNLEIYYAVFFEPMKNGWYFLMPAEHGPTLNLKKKEKKTDILVGPFSDRDRAQRQCNVTYNACLGRRA